MPGPYGEVPVAAVTHPADRHLTIWLLGRLRAAGRLLASGDHTAPAGGLLGGVFPPAASAGQLEACQ
jgi:hypothetical protein